MAIAVTCPSCRASFRVDDKFAGRQGPCPKCKAPITIPQVEKVVIHEADGAATSTTAEGAAKQGKTGVQALKPIARTEVQFRWLPAVGMVLGALALVGLAFVFRRALAAETNFALSLRTIGLWITAIPTSIGAYAILRNDELEPYRGGALWGRVLVCATVYAALWVGFYFIPTDIRMSGMTLIVITALAIGIGGSLSMVLFDLDFGSGVFHCILFLAATILLGYVAQLGWPWTGVQF
jgi:hypothetical protein